MQRILVHWLLVLSALLHVASPALARGLACGAANATCCCTAEETTEATGESVAEPEIGCCSSLPEESEVSEEPADTAPEPEDDCACELEPVSSPLAPREFVLEASPAFGLALTERPALALPLHGTQELASRCVRRPPRARPPLFLIHAVFRI